MNVRKLVGRLNATSLRLPDDSRECVREYLRGIYQRGRINNG